MYFVCLLKLIHVHVYWFIVMYCINFRILLMHVEPQGPSYQIKLRGVARDMLPELSDG